MGKTNAQIEYECSLHWLQNYREQQAAGRKVNAKRVAAMQRHVQTLVKRSA